MGPRRRLAQVALIALMSIGSVVLWLGIPVFWLALASRLQEASRPAMGPYLLVIVGIPLSMVVVGKGLAALNRAYGRLTGSLDSRRVQLPWQRSMRGERGSTRRTTVLDVVMVASVAAALAVFAVWFFLFAGSSLPSA